MTNWEKHREWLLKLSVAGFNLAVIDGEPTKCGLALTDTDCDTCHFKEHNSDCNDSIAILKWLDEECKEDNTCSTCRYFHHIENYKTIGFCDILRNTVPVTDVCKRGSKDD